MNCRDVTRLLNGYVDGELDLMGALAVEEHMRNCSRCRVRETALRSLGSAIRKHTEFLSAPHELRERLHACYGRRNAGGLGGLRRWSVAGIGGLAVLLLLAFAGLAGLKQDGVNPAEAQGKVVFHISSSDTASVALRNLANHLEASPHTKVVVVAHNNGVDFLLRGARDESGQFYEIAVRKLRERGVDFRVCNNTLARRSISPSRVIPEASLVPSGVAEITRLQAEEGYAYMRL
jgi:intracellular sulfur oxidation DsrE/DsrF family protein